MVIFYTIISLFTMNFANKIKKQLVKVVCKFEY